MAAIFLSTRLQPPVLRPGLTARPRLIERLDEGLRPGCRLVLVSAPAGYGKTTLVTAWLEHLARTGGPSPVWLALEEGDSDPARFFTYLVSALRTLYPDLGGGLLSLLALPQLPPPEALFTELINEFAASANEFAASAGSSPQPCLIVLDDLHLLRGPALLDGLAFFLEHLPAHCRLVISTREDPPLPLSRMRVRGELVEARLADLRFTQDEAAAFFQQAMGAALDPAALNVLETRTEGWIAGLQLAALALRDSGGQPDADLLDEFGGSHRYVIDYLVDEVLRRQTEEMREFLVQTSVLERFNADLCRAVMGGGLDAPGADHYQHLLETLDRANLFLIPLDGTRTWFRYHHLFGDVLRAGLTAGQEAELHRRAAVWWEGEVQQAAALGRPAAGLRDALSTAVRHYLVSASYADAARLIAAHAAGSIRYGELHTLMGWLDALPPSALEAEPDLLIYQSLALMLTGQVPRALKEFARLEAGAPHAGDLQRARRLALKSWLRMVQGRFDFQAEVEEALALLAEADPFFRILALLAQGTLLQWSGDLPGSTLAFEEAYRLGQREDHLFGALGGLSNLVFNLSEMGRLREGKALCLEALERYVDGRGRPLPVLGMVYVPLAVFLFEENDLDGAERYAALGQDLCQRLFSSLMMGGDAEIVLAKVAFSRGDPERALAIIEQERRLGRERGVAAVTLRMDLLEADLRIRMGQPDEAQRCLEQSGMLAAGALPGANAAAQLALARLRICQNRPAEALELLAELEQHARSSGRVASLINVLITRARAQAQAGDLPSARESLAQALILGAPEGYVRAFLHPGASILPLLREACSAAPAFVDELLAELSPATAAQTAAAAQPAAAAQTPASRPHPDLLEPLSEQETNILRLVAQGKSNSEIAERLYITVGTAKWHVHNILSKLGVNSRTQAIARARELNVID